MNAPSRIGRFALLFVASIAFLTPAHAIGTPQLLWQRGGCTSWCMTGWYGSPAVVDLDGNGSPEVIYSSYKTWVLDAATGTEYWSVYNGHDIHDTGSESVGRSFSSVAIGDIDHNGSLDIVTAHSGGWVCALSITGEFLPGWPICPAPSSEMRSLALDDLDNDGDLEILTASTSNGDDQEWYVHEHTGVIRPGWPQHEGPCYAAGCYNQNLASADIDMDGVSEIIGPNDTHYVCAFNDDGSCIPANGMYGSKFWGQVGVWVDLEPEIRGWGNCGIEHRPNFAAASPSIADLDKDGTLEIVLTGNVHNCETDPYTDLYTVPLIFNADRSRFARGAFDWTVLPAPPSPGAWAPLEQDWEIIENCQPNPTLADLDRDGFLEIIYPAYDGFVHAFRLDGAEFGSWPFPVTIPGEGFYRFAGEVVVADLEGDGPIEVIFGSWTQKSSGAAGRLHVLSAEGELLHQVDLPQDPGEWNGILGAPTLADIDGDSGLELVAGTAATGVIAYDLPGAQGNDAPWPTGRANFRRTAAIPAIPPSLGIDIALNQTDYVAGDTLSMTFSLENQRGNLDCDLYLAVLVGNIPVFLCVEPSWPAFDSSPCPIALRPLPGGYSIDPIELLSVNLGGSPLPEITLDWYAVLVHPVHLGILAMDHEAVGLHGS